MASGVIRLTTRTASRAQDAMPIGIAKTENTSTVKAHVHSEENNDDDD